MGGLDQQGSVKGVRAEEVSVAFDSIFSVSLSRSKVLW